MATRGDLVLGAIASANRDARQFDEPDLLDLGRYPNRHLSFTIRPCDSLAAPVARLVARSALETLLESADFIPECESTRLAWRQELAVRALESLPVRIVRWRS